ncbi:hypothetical protein HPB49_006997 [Dermacentor silvarum]|uniref:Uncharacterized protein n=1 Tax=Dermacentor silvarum TaxID=543639 RepID=A0ACB8C7Y5_DERSI|nr:hypothetical protein HPB49_006997 [Dermacentor silvarum]
MGQCFAPRCKSDYKTCTEKVSLFAPPREADRLKIWRHAIPRKDRVLQSTDYMCARSTSSRELKRFFALRAGAEKLKPHIENNVLYSPHAKVNVPVCSIYAAVKAFLSASGSKLAAVRAHAYHFSAL